MNIFRRRSQTLYTDTKFPHSDAMLEEYTKDCEIVRKGVQSDIDKCLKEGKSLIIEGFHIDPRLYHQEIQTQAMDLINKAGCSGIVLPFLLTLDEKNHAEFLHNSPDPRYHSSNASDGFENLRNVQSYLIDQVNGLPSKSFTEIPVNLHSFHETLDIMHDIVLDKINEVYKMNNGNLI